jgi:hypothetical protein
MKKLERLLKILWAEIAKQLKPGSITVSKVELLGCVVGRERKEEQEVGDRELML